MFVLYVEKADTRKYLRINNTLLVSYGNTDWFDNVDYYFTESLTNASLVS